MRITYLSMAVGGWVACRGEDVEEDEGMTLVVEGGACTEDPRQAVYAEVAIGVPGVDVVTHLSAPCCCKGCQEKKSCVFVSLLGWVNVVWTITLWFSIRLPFYILSLSSHTHAHAPLLLETALTVPTDEPWRTFSAAPKVYLGFSKMGGSWFVSITEMATSASTADLAEREWCWKLVLVRVWVFGMVFNGEVRCCC